MDGTLLNTLEDLKDSINFVLREHGFPSRSLEEIRRFVGNGVERLVRLSVPEGTGEAVISDCLKKFKQHYSGNMRNKTAPYAGVLPMLNQLKAEGLKLAVVSNKFDDAVKELCRDYFGDWIPAAFGESKDATRKPAPYMVFKALRALDSTPEKTVYVGDSEVDVETAKNAGLDFVGVTWGFRSREVLLERGAVHIIDRPEELLKFTCL